jgi:sugar lactone lactonase YvrE
MRGDAEVISGGHAFLEAPRWRAGRIYASDFYTGEVLRWDGDGEPTVVCRVPGQPSGLGWDLAGDLLVVSMVDRRVLRLAAAGGLREVADLGAHAPWHCNDMVVDGSGRAYVGNFGWDDETEDRISPTVLLRVDADGSVVVVADDLVNPNGMVISADGATLLVNETFAGRITAFERDVDGSLAGRRVWAAFSERPFATVGEALASGAILPDGLALDREGAVWVGDCRGTGAVRVAEGGEVLDFVSTAAWATFAVALGGPDRRTLILCTGAPYGTSDPSRSRDGALCRHIVDVPGAGLP